MRFLSRNDYPPYYQVIVIQYIDRKQQQHFGFGWLSIDDDDNYIWILEDNETPINDNQVIDWSEY